MMSIEIGKNVLVTTDNWFLAPDGLQYRGVFGELKGIFSAEETLGIKTNAKSTNWYLQVGNMTIAGCQVHYAIQKDTCTTHPVKDGDFHEGNYIGYRRKSFIYDASEEAAE